VAGKPGQGEAVRGEHLHLVPDRTEVSSDLP
jgi:hypothetical protein